MFIPAQFLPKEASCEAEGLLYLDYGRVQTTFAHHDGADMHPSTAQLEWVNGEPTLNGFTGMITRDGIVAIASAGIHAYSPLPGEWFWQVRLPQTNGEAIKAAFDSMSDRVGTLLLSKQGEAWTHCTNGLKG